MKVSLHIYVCVLLYVHVHERAVCSACCKWLCLRGRSMHPFTSVPNQHSLDLHVNLRNLMNALSSVESKWYKIGVQLSIPPCKLRTFEVDYHSCERRLSESLLFWLDGNHEIPVTWESIVQVLSSPSVNENSLACQIQAKFCQLTSSSSSQGKQ